MKRYSRKELKLMLKTNTCPHDAPSEIHREIERRRLEIERKMLSNEEEMDNFLRQFQARKWQPIKKPNWASWFHRKLGVLKRPKIVNWIKNSFR
jgi:hypothetical protein